MAQTDTNDVSANPKGVSTGSVIVGVVILLVVLTGLGFFFYGRIVDGYKAVRLLTGHELTQGVIYQGGGYRTNAQYRVSIEGQTYTGQAGTYPSRGDSIEIAYIKGSGHIHRPKNGLWGDAIFGVVFAAGVCIAVVFFIYSFVLDISKAADKVMNRGAPDDQDHINR